MDFAAPSASAHRRRSGRIRSLRVEAIDAVVGGESLGLDVAEQLRRLGPFGKGNPEIRLLVPGARVGDVRPMGAERHARFTLASGSRRALGVAFGVNGELDAAASAETPLDVSLRLEINHWNGAVEPRVVLGHLYEPSPRVLTGDDERPADEEWWRRVEAELAVDPDASGDRTGPPANGRRAVIDRRGHAGVAAVAALASAGGAVLVVACDALRRRELVDRAAAPARFGGGRLSLASTRLADAAVVAGADAVLADGGVVLADWPALERMPDLARRFEHVVAIDPPPSARARACRRSGRGLPAPRLERGPRADRLPRPRGGVAEPGRARDGLPRASRRCARRAPRSRAPSRTSAPPRQRRGACGCCARSGP